MRYSASDIEKWIVLPDIHLPYIDMKTMIAVESFMQDNRFDGWLCLGDLLDFNEISKFNQDAPRRRTELVKQTFDAGNTFLDRQQKIIRKNNKHAKFVYLEGNHEFRVEDYMDRHEQLSGILDVEANLHLEERDIKWVKNWSKGELFSLGNATFSHGLFTNQYHANKMASRFGTCIYYGHCFDKETELLTKRGWLKYKDLSIADECLTMNKDNELLEWNTIKKIHVFDHKGKMINIKSSNIDIMCDKEHGLISRPCKKSKLQYYKAKELLNGYIGGYFKNSGLTLENVTEYSIPDDILRICAWIYSEGCLYKIGNTDYIEIVQSKKYGIDRIKSLLDKNNISYSLKEKTKSDISKITPYRFRLHSVSAKYLMKYLDNHKNVPSWFSKLSNRQFKIFTSEYIKGDGSISHGKYKNASYIYSKQKSWIDAFQARLFMCGYNSKIYNRKNSNYQLNIDRRKETFINSKHHVSEIQYNDKMWCVTVNNGTVVVRRNGRVTITQNTHDVQEISLAHLGSDKTIVGKSLGCLCDVNQKYMKGNPSNWQQAIAVFYIFPDGYYTEHTMRIFKHRFATVDGKIYDGDI